jgi:tetratricopeptide (TPR) repeat protein
MAVPIRGLNSLLTEVEAGHPVIVFENLALSWLPQWHYAIVFGYDLSREKVIMHSGPEAFKQWDLRKFERSWSLADYWGLVILPTGERAASAGEWEHIKAAAALEGLAQFDEAQQAYGLILRHWPQSLLAYIGLANIAFHKKDYKKAEALLSKAIMNAPESAIAWHNLAIAQGANKKTQQAQKSARQALSLASPDEKQVFAEALKSWTQ